MNAKITGNPRAVNRRTYYEKIEWKRGEKKKGLLENSPHD